MTTEPIARVQIAGVHDHAEAVMLAEAGVAWIGIPLCLPVNREDLTRDEAAAVVAAGAPPATFVLITYLRRGVEIARLAQRLGVRHVQIHGPVAPPDLAILREALPGVVVIKSLVVQPGQPADELLRLQEHLAAHVDAFILDTYDPTTGASGATGRTHDWSVSRAIVMASPRPVIMAGGLTPSNVRQAILAVRPAGVDAHTGVEGPDGRKDPARVRAFVVAAHGAFAELDAAAGHA